MSNPTGVDGHRERLRRQFRKGGLGAFEPHNALELLLFYCVPRKDTKPLAKQLIATFGSFDRVLEADYESLLAIDGIGEGTATFLKLLLESYRYYEVEKSRDVFRAVTPDSVTRYVTAMMTGVTNEVCYLLCFDAQKRLTNTVLVATGNATQVAVTTRRICEISASNKADSVILVHNHPQGDARASLEDLNVTNKVYAALKVMGVELIDHIIVCGKHTTSLADIGALYCAEIRGG